MSGVANHSGAFPVPHLARREHGTRRIYTADHDLHAFHGIEVVNPLRP